MVILTSIRVAQEIVLLCQKSKSSNFKLIFPFQMKSNLTYSIFSPIGGCLVVAKSIFVFLYSSFSEIFKTCIFSLS